MLCVISRGEPFAFLFYSGEKDAFRWDGHSKIDFY